MLAYNHVSKEIQVRRLPIFMNHEKQTLAGWVSPSRDLHLLAVVAIYSAISSLLIKALIIAFFVTD